MREKNYDFDLTLIIPAVNYRDFLVRALESVAQQDFKGNAEVIVALSPSGDGADKAVLSFQDRIKNLRLLNVPTEFNLAGNRLAGLKASRGKYVCFMDADDTLAPDMFSKCFETAEKTQADCVVFGFKLVYGGNGKKTRVVKYPLRHHKTYGHYAANKAFLQDLYIRNFAWNKFYRREVFSHKPLLIFNRMGDLFEDVVWNGSLFVYCQKVVAIPDCLYFYDKRITSSMISVKRTNRTFWHLTSFMALRFFYEQKCDEKLLKIMKKEMWRIRLSLKYDLKTDKKNGADKEYLSVVKSAYRTLKDFSKHVDLRDCLFGIVIDRSYLDDPEL